MRKSLIEILIAATAITPVTAAFAQDRGDRNRGSVERVERGDRGSARQVSPQRAAPQRQATTAPRAPQRLVIPQSSVRSQAASAWQRPSDRGAQHRVQERNQVQRRAQQPAQQRVQVQHRAQMRGQVQRRAQQQAQQRVQVQHHSQQRWDRTWRQSQRYNWQQHRQANRTVYRMPAYHAPYDHYRHSRLSIGLTLGSSFLHQRYWISDPWQYRLPSAYPGYQWVRYYDDVLLVDTRTGQVIDVIYDFFW